MRLVEPSDNDLTAPENYWWYFVVTAATALTNHGWSPAGTGALRYQRDRRGEATPAAANRSSAAASVARGSP